MDTIPINREHTYRHLWFGIRNLIHRKLFVPPGKQLSNEVTGEQSAHPGSVLVPANISFSTRHPLYGKVQYVDTGLWRDFWRISFLAKNDRSCYRPHQGERERQRRLRNQVTK